MNATPPGRALRTINRMWNVLPKPLKDTVAATIDRVKGVEIPPPPAVDTSKPIRLFTGPVNYAGQGWAWGRAAMENPLIDARNLVGAENNPFGYRVDSAVRWRTMTHSRPWQRDLLQALTTNYTHVLIEAEMPLLGGMFDEDLRRQIAALRAGGVKVGMVGHGTDIRLPSLHSASERHSFLADDEWTPIDRLEKIVQGNLDLLREVDAPTFVSTAGLLLDVPYGHLLPVVVDAEPWTNEAPVLRRATPRVLHVPSNPVVKGTHLIDPILRRLDAEGLIEYVQLVDRSHSQMPALVADSDIVLDQFRVGDYGVFACEAMASGRLVISHVSRQVRDVVRTDTGHELPIVEAEVDDLERVLRDVVARPEVFRAIAAQGPGYVRDVHDGRVSRDVLERHFLTG